MIECKVIDRAEDHLLIRSTEPCRIEVSVCNGKLILHVYTGAEVNEEQHPTGGYMGSEPGYSWRYQDGASELIDEVDDGDKVDMIVGSPPYEK